MFVCFWGALTVSVTRALETKTCSPALAPHSSLCVLGLLVQGNSEMEGLSLC